MTEYDWLKTRKAIHLVNWLGVASTTQRISGTDKEGQQYSYRIDDRKARLIACAVNRLHIAYFQKDMIDEVEQGIEDGVVDWNTWRMRQQMDPYPRCATQWVALELKHMLNLFGDRHRNISHAGIVRDIIGNPWRPILEVGRDWKEFIHHDKHVLFYDAWRTHDVLAIAEAAYHDRQPETRQLRACHLLPLADALIDAGCPEDNYILGHLRCPEPHYRGCWAIDLILGKHT